MKEFILYKIYMILLELAKYLILIIAAIFASTIYLIGLTNITFLLVSIIIGIVAYLIYGSMYRNKLKGKIGEYITQKVIESYCNKRGYSYLYDVMIKNEMIETSQIDHLIITRKGIAVIETKFHDGTIYGSEFDENWTYITRDNENRKHKNYYHNPIRQNYGHIEALKKIVDKDVQYYNIVLFIDSVNLKKSEVANKFTKYGYTYDLNKMLESFDSLSEKKISSEEAYEIYNKIKEANIVDKQLRQEHIDRIKQNQI
jgi:DNA-binding FrmR family transcriptional regulator